MEFNPEPLRFYRKREGGFIRQEDSKAKAMGERLAGLKGQVRGQSLIRIGSEFMALVLLEGCLAAKGCG